jgi:hypothetical protein
MSVHFISGKPGGGKTLYSVRLIVDELVRGDRPIVTNVPLNLGRLNEYLQQSYPRQFAQKFESSSTHITDRVILIDEDDLPKFFTFRGNAVRLDSVPNAEWKTGKRPDYNSVKDAGVFYVLDEVHIAFNARAWAETGHEVLYYLSQHRKLGDDVVCITQAVANVDKQFRSVAQDFTYIKNLSKQKVGLFRLPALFTRNTYSQPATDTSKPMETGSFTMDVSGTASCYDTAKGVGIHGRAGADTNARKKGLSWIWFAITAPLALWFVFNYLPVLIAWATDPHPLHKQPSPAHQTQTNSLLEIVPTADNAHTPGGKDPTSHSAGDVSSKTDLTSHNHLGPLEYEKQLPQPYCTGYIILDKPQAFFSDGSIVEPPDLEIVAKTYVQVDGKKFPILNPPPNVSKRDRASENQPTAQPLPPTPNAYFETPQISNPVQVTVIGQPRPRQEPPPRVSGFRQQQAQQTFHPQSTGGYD